MCKLIIGTLLDAIIQKNSNIRNLVVRAILKALCLMSPSCYLKNIYLLLLHGNDISANLNDFLFHKNTVRLSYIHCAIDKETNQLKQLSVIDCNINLLAYSL